MVNFQPIEQDGVKCRGEVHKEQPCMAPLVLQVGHVTREGCGAVNKLVGVKSGWETGKIYETSISKHLMMGVSVTGR